jgi:hypothetical protein
MFIVTFYDKDEKQTKERLYTHLEEAVEDAYAALKYDPVTSFGQLLKVEIKTEKWGNRMMQCSIIGKDQDIDGKINIVEWNLVDIPSKKELKVGSCVIIKGRDKDDPNHEGSIDKIEGNKVFISNLNMPFCGTMCYEEFNIKDIILE